ncbi:MAG: deoxyribodipyrimidine photo-lyase [Candidatus Latescibacterota bacterium]|nr:MAG: deoxyribodipyrimidine photo-lyase [Candidatus Latescibacterota bacterium]
MKTSPSLLWFRNDLRLADNPALSSAIEEGGAVIPVYIWTTQRRAWMPGAASRWWLRESLGTLSAGLGQFGSRLVLRKGNPARVIEELVRETGAESVHFNRRYDPEGKNEDIVVEERLRRIGARVHSHNASLLFEPETLRTKQGRPYRVFTAFWNACVARASRPLPIPTPRNIPAPRSWPSSLRVEDLGLTAEGESSDGLAVYWRPGSEDAMKVLDAFIANRIDRYADDRNRPDLMGTSRLSPHLHFGEISTRQIWDAVETRRVHGARKADPDGRSTFMTEVGWREFAHHLLFHFPHTPLEPLRPEFSKFPWKDDKKLFDVWCRGETGYPLVDAGMRELATTGWMHNRVRMVTASFLVKHLLIPWQRGAAWFWEKLVDADLANNTLGWQWTAGCGADAAPFFRIFNPVSQGERFDPEGQYVRRWVPELGGLPDKWIHRPWQTPSGSLKASGIELGRDYPRPIVDHMAARRRALKAFDKLKTTRTQNSPA